MFLIMSNMTKLKKCRYIITHRIKVAPNRGLDMEKRAQTHRKWRTTGIQKAGNGSLLLYIRRLLNHSIRIETKTLMPIMNHCENQLHPRNVQKMSTTVQIVSTTVQNMEVTVENMGMAIPNLNTIVKNMTWRTEDARVALIWSLLRPKGASNTIFFMPNHSIITTTMLFILQPLEDMTI